LGAFLAVREKLKSSWLFLLVGDRNGIWPQKLCTKFAFFQHGSQKKWVGYSPLYLVGNPICLQQRAKLQDGVIIIVIIIFFFCPPAQSRGREN